MGVNINGNEIKKVILDSNVNSNFPKRKDGKNDRKAMLAGLEHGHKYYATLTVIYADWTEYETTLTLEKLFENRAYVQVRDKDRFETFVLKFDTLLKDELKKGEFVQELQIQSDKYFKRIIEMNEKIAKANKEADEQKNIVKFFKGKCENQLVVIEEKDRKIVSLEEKIHSLESSLGERKDDIKFSDESLEKFIDMAEYLANAKIDHKNFKSIMEKQFKELFLK